MSGVEILVVIEAEIATTHLIEQVLKACASQGVNYRVKLLEKLRASDFVADTIPLFVRTGDSLALFWTQTLVDANYPYVFYIDDNFWRLSGNSALAAYYRHPIVRKSLEFSISNAMAVVTNSAELAKFLSRFSNSISVLPTFFDFSLIEGVQPSSGEQIRIGFSGSPSRVDDLDLIAPIIEPILEKFPQTIFEFAGALPRGITPSKRVLFFPHTQDYNSYIRFQAGRNWAVCLAPLLDHEANRSKTDNKYREYGACCCAGIYSDILPYSEVVENTVTGLLVRNTPSSWLDALTELVANSTKRTAIAQNAFSDVKERYDISHVSQMWAQFFVDLSGRRSSKQLGGNVSVWRQRQRRLERWRLHLAIVYDEGGLPLVIWRIFRKSMLTLRKLLWL
jgi:glycosyltransferase involved in cell wall biosynthesis